jgi:hypothetical protein
MLEILVLFFMLGLGGLVLVGMVAAIIGFAVSTAFGVAAFVFFQIVPVVLLGWVVLKLVQRGAERRRITMADERWLDS